MNEGAAHAEGRRPKASKGDAMGGRRRGYCIHRRWYEPDGALPVHKL